MGIVKLRDVTNFKDIDDKKGLLGLVESATRRLSAATNYPLGIAITINITSERGM